MMTKNTMNSDTSMVVACSLSEQDLAQRGQELARGLFAFAERVEELPDGYVWHFPGDGAWHAKLLDFVAAERRCCGFFRIELVFEPGLGPVSLSLRGPEGTKGFISETFVA
jgi:hypothetical protein